jgi:HSP20 family molecular chaperone IbpA
MSQTLMKNQDAQVAQAQQSRPQERQLRYPPVDISERENEFIIEADMPGVQEGNIDIQYHQGELTIQGKIDVPENAGENYRFRQFESTDFYRAFRIGESVDAANISAQCADGVLTVHLPKAETLKPRKIDVARKI